jgi:hypothetical protein
MTNDLTPETLAELNADISAAKEDGDGPVFWELTIARAEALIAAAEERDELKNDIRNILKKFNGYKLQLADQVRRKRASHDAGKVIAEERDRLRGLRDAIIALFDYIHENDGAPFTHGDDVLLELWGALMTHPALTPSEDSAYNDGAASGAETPGGP